MSAEPTPKNSNSITDCLELIEPVCKVLEELSSKVDQSCSWPEESIAACIDGGVLRWFLPKELGGWEWSESQILVGYLRLSQTCMTTTFILTQWQAAVRRILKSENLSLLDQIGPKLADGSCFVTVGISQLSTSRQHTDAALKAVRTDGGFRLDGYSPWVTAAPASDLFVLGASLDDGSQIIAAVPSETQGMKCHPGTPLLALSASCTDRVELDQVEISNSQILAGPAENVLLTSTSSGGGVGGLHTSILAIGLAMAATAYLREQSYHRSSLRPIADKLSAEVEVLRMNVELMMTGNFVMTNGDLRRRANTLVLRATQAALQVAKGSGFVSGHPVGRWAREALFFLVWSCPQPVVEANLCDLAGLESSL